MSAATTIPMSNEEIYLEGLQQIVRETHNRRDYASRRVNSIAVRALRRAAE